MTFKRFVNAIEILVGVVALVFVFLLFANEPDTGSAGGANASPGAKIYASSCAGCHGADGGGGVGPKLAGTVTKTFPDVADQIKVVSEGRGSMPSFEDSLTPEQIEHVVEYTRTDLGS